MDAQVEKLRESVLDIKNPRFYQKQDPKVVGAFTVFETASITDGDDSRRKLSPLQRKALAYKQLAHDFVPTIEEGEIIVGAPLIDQLPAYLFEDEHRQYHNPTGIEHPNNLAVGYYNIVEKGFRKIADEAKALLDACSEDEVYEKAFLGSVITSCEAMDIVAQKYAAEAIKVAKVCNDEKRKAELLEIARIFGTVPMQPAGNFREALQAIWITHIMLRADGSFHLGLGRFDQYLWPLYKKDIDSGIMTREQAKTLLEFFWIKFNEFPTIEGYLHGDNGQTMIVGGRDDKGVDCTNDLSFLCLDVAKDMHTLDPKVLVRIHKKSTEEFLRKIAELAREGMGYPTINNDEAIIPALVDIGYDIEDATNYCTSGCYEILVPGRSNDKVNWGEVCFLKALEATLNNGKSMLSGETWGPDYGNLETYNSFDELYIAFKKQIDKQVADAVTMCNSYRYGPAPLLSATMDDCVGNRKDISDGGCKYNFTGLWGSSVANTTNSLMAIKRLVYENGTVTASEFYQALKNNYEHDELLLKMIGDVPKFGQDDDETDAVASDFVNYYARQVSKQRNTEGFPYKPSLASAWSYVFMGRKLGASADGRRASEPFSNGVSPALGTEKKGPTAVIKSVSKINMKKLPNGSPLDIKLSKAIAEGRDSLDQITWLLKAFCDLDGANLQINVVDNKTLIEAQNTPDKYKDLIVRVWGFSSYFVTLTKDFQDHIIRRNEHGTL
jgi:formate C-acetyltransferase